MKLIIKSSPSTETVAELESEKDGHFYARVLDDNGREMFSIIFWNRPVGLGISTPDPDESGLADDSVSHSVEHSRYADEHKLIIRPCGNNAITIHG